MKKIIDMKSHWENDSNNYQNIDEEDLGLVCYVGMPYWFNKFMDKFQKKSFNELIKGISLKNKKILDIGCGVGRWCLYFNKFSNKVTGIDIDKIRLKKAKLKNDKTTFLQMFANKLSFKSNSFDFINSITVLQHIPYNKKFLAIQEIGRVTKKGGYVLIIELIDINDDAKHIFPMTKKEWITKFETEGFKLIKQNGYEYIPLLRILRWIQFKTIGRKTIKKESGKIKLSRLEFFILRLIVYISYPIESFCSSFISNKHARHGGFLFLKIK